MNESEPMSVRITRATRLLWEGKASAVSSKNVDGPFDILPLHANFVTLIRGEPISITLVSGEKKEYNFKYAVIHVQGNTVKIYADFL
jgi:F0F1-type ATP synthase epsilon subunit